MKSATAYFCKSNASRPDRERLVVEQLYSALMARADIERKDLTQPDRRTASQPQRLTGLAIVRPREPIMALGCAAHTALADFEKHTLIATDLGLGAAQGGVVKDVEQFVWSCTNTLRIVALGASAWQSAQLLPIADRRRHAVPPLRFAGPITATRSVLVIDHEPDGVRGRALVAVLEAADIEVDYVPPSSHATREAAWSSNAPIHVHVGDHTLDAEEPRLVDTWRSDRLALQLASDRWVRRDPDPDVLTIENEVNGIICSTPEDVERVCRELDEDRVLRKKLIAAGQATAAPLMKGWGAVADDLLP